MESAISPRALSELIGSIYDCALDPARWDQTLADIAQALRCRTAQLYLTDLREQAILISKCIGMTPEMLEHQAKHVPEINSLMSELLAARRSPDDAMVVSRAVSRAYFDASPYFHLAAKLGFVDFIQYSFLETPTRNAGVGFGRGEEQGVITARELELGALLLPHLRRAVTISNVLDVGTIEQARKAEALDALRCAVVLTDERGAILHTNRSAEDMLRDHGPVRTVRGVLQAKAPAAAKELRAAIGLAARDEAQLGKTGLSILLSEPGALPIFAHVLPMRGGELRTRLDPAAVAAVFIGAAPDEQATADLIAAAYGLTPAETRVLASLLGGRTLAETAAALGVAPTTAKTHLDSIFGKTGTARQAELVRLAATILPPARLPT
jgi:DNA-binding CsgD family transcriptional regulator/PAS domain-containing protein